ncbi:MAG: sigma-70 family RNA polymerase sigma factor [Terracidiphilus sp.]
MTSKRKNRATQAPSMQDVLTRARAGDEDAFAELYQRHKKRVLCICMNMVHNFSQAEDLMQETFLQVHRKLATFRAESAFTTWLHRITVNIVLMHLRKRTLPVVSLDEMMTNVPGENVGRVVGTRDLAQAGVTDRVAIDRAALNLAPGYRSIFLLHDVEGFQHEEIAAMLDCSLGCSKSQLHKARRVLRFALSKHGEAARRDSNAISNLAAI